MCGIVGFTKKKYYSACCLEVLLNGLENLEYRGYDSAGIAVSDMEHQELKLCRAVGRISNLRRVVEEEKAEGSFGIGHTRWATHGKPSTQNSHPHLDNSNSFAVVPNGII